jgi:UDP-glucose 4-epimerase
MANAAGVDADALRAPARAGELERSCLDPTKAGIHLGWRPWTSLEEGVAAVLEHFSRSRGG